MFRKCLFWLHLIAGILTGGVILVMSVTGALLTYERQMVAWAEKGLHTTPAPGQRLLSPDELLAARAALTTDAPLPGSITLPLKEGAPASISFGRGNTLFLNPYTGEELGRGHKIREFFREVTAWHRWLGDRDIGKPFTGVSNLAFLFLAISGLYLWWPKSLRWKSFKPVLLFNFKLKGKARDFNWHNVIGLWSAPILIILTATGAVFSYQWANNLVYTLSGSEAPPPRGAGPGGPPAGARPKGSGARKGASGRSAQQASAALPSIGLTPFFEAAKSQAPLWQAITINLPAPGAKNVTATVETSDAVHPYARHNATFSLAEASIEKWEPFEKQDRGRRARSWVRALHTGEAGGIVGQSVAGLASLGGAFLVFTGFTLSWRRFFGKKRKQTEENRKTEEEKTASLV